MIITEYDIVDLYDAARQAMGDEAADLLMPHLGVYGWPQDYVRVERVPSGPTLIAANAAREVYQLADKLSAMIASYFSGGNASIGLTCWIPALFTRISIPPYFSTVFSTNTLSSSIFPTLQAIPVTS